MVTPGAASTRAAGRVLRVFRREPLLFVGAGAIVGIVAVDQGAWLWAGGSAAALAMGAWTARRRAWPGWPVPAASLACLIVFGAGHRARLDAIHSFPLAGAVGKGQSVEIAGVGWIASDPRTGNRSASALVQLDALVLDGHEIPCGHRLPTWIQRPTESLGYGTEIRFTGLVRPLETAQAPGGFDPRAFHFRQSGSLARMEIREGDDLAIAEGERGSRLVAASLRLRKRMEAALRTSLRPDDLPFAQVVAAMTLGVREDTPDDLEDLFRLSGTMHLFAVSGMHVGIVGGCLLGLAISLRIPRRHAVLVVIPLILFYAVLTGLRPSAIRAAVMLSIFLAGYAFREKPRLLNALGLAGLAILAFDTQQIFLPGFQLSFMVLLFIALLAAGLRSLVAKPFLPDPFVPRSLLGGPQRSFNAFVGVAAAALAVSIASWLGSAGLLSWHFQSLAPVGIVANLLMVPLAGVVIVLACFSLACFGLKLVWLAAVANKLSVGVAILLTSLAHFFADLPGAHRNTGHPTADAPGAETLTVDVMGDRGEGAVLLSLPEQVARGRSFWMIDTGGPRTYRRQALPTMRSRGVNRLGGLVLTHGDSGHIGAASEVLSRFRPGLLLESGAGNRSPAYPGIVSTAESLDIERIEVSRGHRIRFGEGVTLEIFAPSPDRPGRLADDRSLVMKLSCHDWSLLFTSDAGFATEKALLESGVDLSADVWIRGQHNQSPSGLPAFVEAVAPRAVVSTHSGFPASEQIPESLKSQLGDAGVALFALDSAGVVTIEVDPGELRLSPFSLPDSAIEFSAEAPRRAEEKN
ncbi:MAG: ComEC/Rec2 family competence protein [Verrucomicrobiales bacterium]